MIDSDEAISLDGTTSADTYLVIAKIIAAAKAEAQQESVKAREALREVERVLVPEGRVVISGFNPWSLWGLSQQRARLYQRLGWGTPFLPGQLDFIAHWRMRDWLRLLSFDVQSTRLGCYRPAVKSERWLQRYEWMDTAGQKWWPIFGATYCVVAIKRVRGTRLLSPVWKRAKERNVSAVTTVSKEME